MRGARSGLVFLLATVRDNTFASGQLWIAAGSTAGPSAQTSKPVALFRNLVIAQQ